MTPMAGYMGHGHPQGPVPPCSPGMNSMHEDYPPEGNHPWSRTPSSPVIWKILCKIEKNSTKFRDKFGGDRCVDKSPPSQKCSDWSYRELLTVCLVIWTVQSVWMSRKSVWMSRRSVWMSRKSVWMSRKSVWMSRKCIWMSRKSVWMSRKSVWMSRKSVQMSRKSVWMSRKSVWMSRKSVWMSRKSIWMSRKSVWMSRKPVQISKNLSGCLESLLDV